MVPMLARLSLALLALSSVAGCDSPPRRAAPDPEVARPPVAAVQTGAPTEPGALATGPSQAAIAARAAEVQRRMPAGFTLVVQPPFVVAGDETPDHVRARSRDTVQWAVDKLRADFFDRAPSKVISVWLFKDAESYRDHALALFGDRPSTPYGYYSPTHEALIMNIATGGGTLVHEIVHPFVEADFPGAPPWLNEGLGSLFEQSAERDGHIVGLPNWRLPALQRALRAGTVQSFGELTSLDETQFYDDERSGLNYAQARYLLLWLQERDLLVRFYKAHRAARETDPTGYRTLQTVLGARDEVGMAAAQKLWATFVSSLSFP
jgi:hypothetical protein